MGLALLTLCLLCASPGRAQSGYPGGPGWVAKAGDPVVTGNVSGTFTDAQGNISYLDRLYVNDGSSPPLLRVNAGESLTYKVNGTVVYTWKWNGGPNNVPPPALQGVRETATAGASGGGDINGTVTTTASDGGIGKENKVDSVSDDGKTQSHSDGFGGARLVTLDGSSGTLTVTGTIQAECDLSEPKSSGGYPGGGYPGGGYPGSGGSGTLRGSAGGYFFAALDTRALTISVPALDATKNKEPDLFNPIDANGDTNYVGVPHVREANGTMRGDVGLPLGGVTINDGGFTNITYHANLTGNWKPAGSYNWFSSLKQQGDNGSLYPPDFTNAYLEPWWVGSETVGVPPHIWPAEADPKKPDHINIKCVDGEDGTAASADYYMTLHPALEKNYPDHMTRGIENLRKAPNASYVRSTQDDSTVTVYAENGDEWGVTATTDGPFGDFIAGILGVNLSVSYSISYNSGVQTSIQHVNVGFATYLEEFDAYKYHTGKVDLWNMSGYSGTAPYHLKEPDSPAGGYQAHSPPVYLGAG